MTMMTVKNTEDPRASSDEEQSIVTPLTDAPLLPDWDEPVEAYPDEEDEDEQDTE